MTLGNITAESKVSNQLPRAFYGFRVLNRGSTALVMERYAARSEVRYVKRSTSSGHENVHKNCSTIDVRCFEPFHTFLEQQGMGRLKKIRIIHPQRRNIHTGLVPCPRPALSIHITP